MIAHAFTALECLEDCTPEDRMSLLRAGIMNGRSFAIPRFACISLGMPDWEQRIATRLAEGRTILALATIAQKAPRIAALKVGAHEFLTMAPVDPSQLGARLQLLATGSALPDEITLDPHARSLAVNGSTHPLSMREFRLCSALLAAKGGFVTHDNLIRHVWGEASTDRQRLRVAINRLRGRIEPEPDLPRYFLSEPAIGYRIGNGQPSRPAFAI